MTIKQFAVEIIRITGTKSGIEYKPLPVDDPQVRRPDIDWARMIEAFSDFWSAFFRLDIGRGRPLKICCPATIPTNHRTHGNS
jgi:hypothetical protein